MFRNDTVLFIFLCLAVDALVIAGIELAPTATTVIGLALGGAMVLCVLYLLLPYMALRLARRYRRFRRAMRQRRFARREARPKENA